MIATADFRIQQIFLLHNVAFKAEAVISVFWGVSRYAMRLQPWDEYDVMVCVVSCDKDSRFKFMLRNIIVGDNNIVFSLIIPIIIFGLFKVEWRTFAILISIFPKNLNFTKSKLVEFCGCTWNFVCVVLVIVCTRYLQNFEDCILCWRVLYLQRLLKLHCWLILTRQKTWIVVIAK